jgi:hypothetical protein
MQPKKYVVALLGGLILIVCVTLVACTPTEPIQVTRIVAATIMATATPTQTAVQTSMPAPEPTATPLVVEATQTVRPTKTASATPPLLEDITLEPTIPQPTQTPTQPIIQGQLPAITHDLLFVADESLKRWNHESGQIEVLLETGVISNTISFEFGRPWPGESFRSFRVSQNGQAAVAMKLIAETPPTYDLVWFDLSTGDSRTLAYQVVYLLDFEIAPDGNDIVYIVGDASAELWHSGWPKNGTIYVQNVESEQQARSIGYCSSITADNQEGKYGCDGLIWSPDGDAILWGDVQGIWERNLLTFELRLLLPNDFSDTGEWVRLKFYSPIDWSPSGRYLRLLVRHYEGSSQAIFDRQSGRVIPIPNTFFYTEIEQSGYCWLENDQFLSVETSGEREEPITRVIIYSFPPDELALKVEASIVLPAAPATYAVAPQQLENGSLVYAVVSYAPNNPLTDGLFWLADLTSTPQKMNHLPVFLSLKGEINWAPDGSGAVVGYFDGRSHEPDFIYVPANESTAYHIQPMLGDYVSFYSFTWVP